MVTIHTENQDPKVLGFFKSDPGFEELRPELGWIDRTVRYLESPAKVPPLSPTYHFHMMSLSSGHRKEVGGGREKRKKKKYKTFRKFVNLCVFI